MPATPENGHPLVVEAGGRGLAPRPGHDAGGQVPQTGQRQHQGVLGHRLGVGTLGARPDPVVVEQSEREHPLDSGERELHPAHIGGHRQLVGEALHLHGVEPDQGIRTF